MHKTYLVTFIVLLTCWLQLTAKPSKFQTYVENLSIHRNKFPNTAFNDVLTYIPKSKIKKKLVFPIEHDITQQLHELLLDLKSYDEMTETISGYTIQAYTGSNRQLAFQTKDKLSSYYATFDVEVQYKQPNFTVKIGKFLDHLEAYELYVNIKKLFPQAIVRPTQFPNKAGIFDPLSTLHIADTTHHVEDDVTLLPEDDIEPHRYQVMEDKENDE